MGNDTSRTIAINLDRTDSFYLTDEFVSGTIGLSVMKINMLAHEIYILLTGEIGYTTTQTLLTGDSVMLITHPHHIPFYSAKVILAQPEAGQKKLVYGQGQYSLPFQIPLIDHLPPTMNQPESYPHIRYYLQVVIDKPNKKEKKYLTIFPRINLLQSPQCLVSTIFGNHNRKDITLKGTLNKLGYVPGELITATLEIENPQRVLIQHINVSIIQSYQIGHMSSGYRILKITLPTILNLSDEQIRETFSMIIPAVTLAPSYHFQGGIKTTVCVDIHYLLKLSVKVKGMFTNFDVDIPITLGTEPNPDQTQQQTFNPVIASYSLKPEKGMLKQISSSSYDDVVENKN